MARLEIYGWLLEASWGVVPKHRLEAICNALRNNEFDFGDFEDIPLNNKETGINKDLEFEIFVDGALQEFNKNLYRMVFEFPDFITIDENEGQFFLIKNTVSKGLIYSCEISEEFDQAKLSLTRWELETGDVEPFISILDIGYDEEQCLDRNTDVKGYIYELVGPDGTICEFVKSVNNAEPTDKFHKFIDAKFTLPY